MDMASSPTRIDHAAISSRKLADTFIEKWGIGGRSFRLGERAGAQAHFIDLCHLLGVTAPEDPENYCFERGFRGIVGGRGFADVWKRGHFAWEYKAPRGDLKAALRQLVQYALPLDNPPLLVVSDRLRIEIHTHFTGHPSEKTTFTIEDLRSSEVRQAIRAIFLSPDQFRPQQSNRDITEQAAASFATIADRLRLTGVNARAAAHFLTQCVFCLFAEGVGLLPNNIFRRVLQSGEPTMLRAKLSRLFEVMRTGGPYGPDDIDWFNGGLFNDIVVPELSLDDASELSNAASLNWKAIDPSIFGTLFERGLDPNKRTQLGAHYTDPSTILRLVEPTIKAPLLAEWERTKPKIAVALNNVDLTQATPLLENQGACFFGLSLAGAFTISGEIARRWLAISGNPNGKPNSDVLRPILNGADITTKRQRDRWVIDFGLMSLEEARLYEAPFGYVNNVVRPVREKNNRESRAKYWWRHGEARPAMRQALVGINRFIVTSETSKGLTGAGSRQRTSPSGAAPRGGRTPPAAHAAQGAR